MTKIQMTKTLKAQYSYGSLYFEHWKIRNWGPARRVGSPQDQFWIYFDIRYSDLECIVITSEHPLVLNSF